MRTVLELCKAVCKKRGLPVPSTFIGSSDPQLMQLEAWLNDLGRDLTRRYSWQAQKQVFNGTTLAAQDQGNIYTLAGGGFLFFENGSFWNITLRKPFVGPLTDEEWQILRVFPANGQGINCYKIFQDHLWMFPAPQAGQSISALWRTKYWAVATGGTSPTKETLTADTDMPVFDDTLMEQGLEYLWLKVKGLPFADEMAVFEETAANLNGREGTKATLRQDLGMPRIVPGIMVPTNNWNVS